ncbi:MAG: lysophospholipid acyltransferase family protein [Candidatus Omnitrophica bacterium]|nr:lysophospholipid acyltransferase family protein [Candidatus Omnitrophota bacterium]
MKIKTRRYYVYYLLKALIFLVGLIPRKAGLMLASFLGKAAFMLLRGYRDTTISNLDEALGRDPRRNTLIAEGVFRNLAKNGAEWIKLASSGREEVEAMVTEASGFEHLDRALAEGKGVILLVSHFGNWELLSIYLNLKGYKGTAVARRIYFHKYDRFIMRLRNRFGAQVLYRDESPRKLLKLLKSGGILGILADQDVDSVEGVFVNFFGKSAYTPAAPVRFGMVTGASLVPAFMIRKPDDTHKLVLEKPLVLLRGPDREEALKLYTRAWTDVLEKYVRQYPEQWVWMHQRWKTRK